MYFSCIEMADSNTDRSRSKVTVVNSINSQMFQMFIHDLLKTVTWRSTKKLNKIPESILSGLSTIRPPINHKKSSIHPFLQRETQAPPDSTYRADLLPILICTSRREIWTLRKEDKRRLTSIEIRFTRRMPGSHCLTTKELRNFWKRWIKNQLTKNRNIQIKMSTKCNTNEQQQNVESNSEL